MTVITIDIGATRVESGFGGWDQHTKPLYVEETPDSKDALITLLRRHIEELVSVARSADRDVRCATFGLPGWVDEDGCLADSPHTSFRGLDIEAELADTDTAAFPFVVENDATAQAVGCARDFETLCYIALGTGIGGAIIDSGRLVEGANGFAGEVGHIPVLGSERPCSCGKKGCLETIASGEALQKDLGKSWWNRSLSSDERRRLEEAGEAVGEAASTMAVLNDPARIVISGHLTSQDSFLRGMKESWNHPWTDCSLETYQETWQFAREGLTKLARQATEK